MGVSLKILNDHPTTFVWDPRENKLVQPDVENAKSNQLFCHFFYSAFHLQT